MISHSKPTLAREDSEEVSRVLLSGKIAQGEKTEGFERATARYVGVREAAAVSSGTAALHLALLALDVGPGDEVILPSYVCVAPLNAILYTGAKPALADVDPLTGNIDPRSAARRVTTRTKAMIVPHMMGQPADIEELSELGVPMVEDLAQAIGAVYRGERVGAFGEIAVCSFYATKVFTSGEGGMVLSSNPERMKKIKDLRDYDEKPAHGVRYNYKMTDMQAALGLSQLRRLPAFIETRERIADYYRKRFENLPVRLPPRISGTHPIYFRFILGLEEKRDQFIREMELRGIACSRPIYRPLHLLLGEEGFPEADRLYRSSVSIPIYPLLTEDEKEAIAEHVIQYFDKGEHHVR